MKHIMRMRNLVLVVVIVSVAFANLHGTLATEAVQTDGKAQVVSATVRDDLGLVVVTPIALPQVNAHDLQAQSAVNTMTGERKGPVIRGVQYHEEATIVARVNGYPITDIEIMEAQTTVSDQLTLFRETVSRIVPDEQVGDRIGNPFDPDSLIPESSGLGKVLGSRISVIELHGIDSVALATFVVRLAVLSEAIRAGHSADPNDVASVVEETKTDFLYGLKPELDHHVSTYGFEVFFDQILTERLSREFTIESWTKELTAISNSYEAGEGILQRARSAAINAAEVVVIDAAAVGTTREKTIAYMNAYYELTPAPL